MRDAFGRDINLDDLVEIVGGTGRVYKVIVMHPTRVTIEHPDGRVAAMIHPNILNVIGSDTPTK